MVAEQWIEIILTSLDVGYKINAQNVLEVIDKGQRSPIFCIAFDLQNILCVDVVADIKRGLNNFNSLLCYHFKMSYAWLNVSK